MKKILIGAIIILLAVGIIWFGKTKSPNVSPVNNNTGQNGSSTPVLPVSETSKVNNLLSEYTNLELGFSVKYPTLWEKIESDLGVSFILPIDKNQASTVSKLQADINVISAKCSFPPVTTVKDRGTLTVGKNTLNTISLNNTIQGRVYFNRLYSLQQGGICYVFSFSSITLDPGSKGLTGSNITQAQNNNKAIVNAADTAFTDVVKSFLFVTGPAGKDEASIVPTIKSSATTTTSSTTSTTTKIKK